MPAPLKIEKAKLQAVTLKPGGADPAKPDYAVIVQFNPESLKLDYGNATACTKSGVGSVQHTSTRPKTLTFQLWFDVTAPNPDPAVGAVVDVRSLTDRLAHFLTPETKGGADLRGVRFLWGSFAFDGVMTSLSENMEFFSPDGRPMRASVSVTLQTHKLTADSALRTERRYASFAVVPPQPDQSIQRLALALALADWKLLAAANRIENPRFVQSGTVIKT